MAGGLLDPLGRKRVKFQGLLGDKYDPNSALDAAPQGLLGPLGLFAMKNAPSFAGSAYDAVTAPGRAMKGELPLYGIDENGNRVIHPEAMDSIMNLAGMLTLGSGAIPAQANELRMGIKAYHGSPHDFDKFDMSKIGTGEGAQAYGHGLYFAENEGVAKEYRDKLTSMRTGAAQRELQKANGDVDAAIAAVRARIDNLRALPNKAGDAERWARQMSIQEEKMSELNKVKAGGDMSSGSMYEVDINADPNAFLDWDKPLSEQPETVRGALEAKVPQSNNSRKMMAQNPTAGDLYNFMSDRGDYRDPVSTSKEFKEAGIPGIKYLDAGSRSAGDGSRNYVVFDDKLITILRKYGWVPGMAIPAAAMQEYNGKEPDL